MGFYSEGEQKGLESSGRGGTWPDLDSNKIPLATVEREGRE